MLPKRGLSFLNEAYAFLNEAYAFLNEAYAFISDSDEPSAIEVADGFFVSLLRHLETVVDEFCGTFVAQVAAPVVLIEVTQQHLCEVQCVAVSCGLQCDVYLSVLAYVVDIGRQPVACVQRLEYLVVVDLPLILVVDDALEAEVGLLPYQAVAGLAVG